MPTAALTVTLPDDDLLARLADLDGRPVADGVVLGAGSGVPGEALGAGRVRLVGWDVASPLDPALAAEVSVVVIPHYFVRPGAFDALAQVPRLRLLQLPSAGYEHALPHVPPGVALANGRGIHDAGTAELALALVLASQRGLDDAVRDAAHGRWAPRLRSSLADRRVLVVGYGSVGAAIARRLEAFETQVVRVASRPREEPEGHVHGVDELPTLLPAADVVVLATPLTEATRGLVDAAFLAAMPDDALLVNVARGAVVDTDALLAELRSRPLRSSASRAATPTPCSRSCAAAGCAPPSTSPIPSRCPRTTRCGARRARSSRRTSAATSTRRSRGRLRWCGARSRRSWRGARR